MGRIRLPELSRFQELVEEDLVAGLGERVREPLDRDDVGAGVAEEEPHGRVSASLRSRAQPPA